MIDHTPFLALVASIQRSAEPQQLDLFEEEASVLAKVTAKDFVDSIQGAGGDLSSLAIQQAVNGARERTVIRLSQFLRQAEMRAGRS
jgi:hypothetical protein